ncbi:Type 1 glutamine amidotransferase-like domain-containing protein [Microbacterium sp. SLBN-146]|uniref:Type 1 glutamine amidotransferase-like domain-containing protein n=1 Tax=Microbacterium sp. SLBN-146 TaxID=2768457 RepID=UPI00116C2F81|nr:Type 1 glutamine amidotransferase-like domain-containing protein [Microbacterium sp. SLBN-146]TQJ31516.1 cyanophycinase [Microbacterium sp. SLBN-146]
MSIHLIGGGRDAARCGAVLSRFVDEARDAAGSSDPVIALLLVLEPDDDESVDRFHSVLLAAGAPAGGIRVSVIAEGGRFEPGVVDGAHGIFVGGGLTPAYHDAIMGIASAIRALVSSGTPYAGFSAGAAIAASRAVVGGYLRRGTAVAPEDVGEELDEIEVRDGLGLVPVSVDVHAAQWGTLTRLIAAVTDDLTPRGVAIDEYTAVIFDEGGSESAAVLGDGHVWSVERAPSGAVVSLLAATTAR